MPTFCLGLQAVVKNLKKLDRGFSPWCQPGAGSPMKLPERVYFIHGLKAAANYTIELRMQIKNISDVSVESIIKNHKYHDNKYYHD
jgi:hypothetical protein